MSLACLLYCIGDMEKEFLQAGKITAPHGLRGEMRMQPWSDGADFLRSFKRVFFDEDGVECVPLSAARAHGNMTLIKLKGVDSIEQAERLRGKIVYVKKSDVPLPDDRAYVSEVIGCSVIDAKNGEVLGKVSDVLKYPASDVFSVDTKNGEKLVPNVPVFVEKIDVKAGEVYINKMKGLFEDED